MSSHREAPEISKDPVADSTDVYAFVSPDKPDTVTLIANYIPLEGPAGGPNFYEFGDDVLYEIHIDNDGDGQADITYQFRFPTKLRNPDTFLYNVGPILSLDSPNWNRRQFYNVTRVDSTARAPMLGEHLPCPPCNIGPLSTPNYADLATRRCTSSRRHQGLRRPAGRRLLRRPRRDLRPRRPAAVPGAARPSACRPRQAGPGSTRPRSSTSTRSRCRSPSPTCCGGQARRVRRPSVIGVWTTASRQ